MDLPESSFLSIAYVVVFPYLIAFPHWTAFLVVILSLVFSWKAYKKSEYRKAVGWSLAPLITVPIFLAPLILIRILG